ncbi:MAG TPA: tetraacyldisaccharide 4'-kinase [Candidatus Obscuribacterales bacterium]
MSWGRPESPGEKLAAALLQPASWAYGVAAYARLQAYSAGLIKCVRPPVPVISVGNITCGGTGKTPVTIDIVRRLIAQGYRPAVLSRGYRRKSRNAFTVVGNGAGVFSSCFASGDEPLLIARSAPEAIVIAGSERYKTAHVAVRDYGADVLVLDDGFQHIRVARDFDLVLVDYNDDPGCDSLLPAGRLREPLVALNRASAIAITKVPKKYDDLALFKLKEFYASLAPRAQVYSLRFVPECLRSHGEHRESLSVLQEKKVVAFCGLARPSSFKQTLADLGCEPLRFIEFPDHHWYTSSDVERLARLCRTSGADLIVTTEKDLVKLSIPERFKSLFYALAIRTEWLGPQPSFLFLPKPTKLERAAIK